MEPTDLKTKPFSESTELRAEFSFPSHQGARLRLPHGRCRGREGWGGLGACVHLPSAPSVHTGLRVVRRLYQKHHSRGGLSNIYFSVRRLDVEIKAPAYLASGDTSLSGH